MAARKYMECTRGHEYPTLDQICNAFCLELEEVLNVNVVGSHMWETCNSSSDWDIVVIVQHFKSPKPQNIHKGNLEAFILSKEQYIAQLDAHSMQSLLTLWLPKNCVLQQRFDPRVNFKFSQVKLAFSLAASKDRDLRVAEKHFRKGNTSRAKRVLVNCIRYLDVGTQMKGVSGKGHINCSSANKYREQVLNDYCQSWEELILSVQFILDDLWSKDVSFIILLHACNMHLVCRYSTYPAIIHNIATL